MAYRKNLQTVLIVVLLAIMLGGTFMLVFDVGVENKQTRHVFGGILFGLIISVLILLINGIDNEISTQKILEKIEILHQPRNGCEKSEPMNISNYLFVIQAPRLKRFVDAMMCAVILWTVVAMIIGSIHNDKVSLIALILTTIVMYCLTIFMFYMYWGVKSIVLSKSSSPSI